MSILNNIPEQFDALQAKNGSHTLSKLRADAYKAFSKFGIPTVKHEEWKFTRVSPLFDQDYRLPFATEQIFTAGELKALRIPGHENANELVFVNGLFSIQLSTIRSKNLTVISLDEAAEGEFENIVADHFDHSSKYQNDGINAINTALVHDALFVHVKKGAVVEHPVYIYNITDARNAHVFAQPRSLFYISAAAQIQIVETFATIGLEQSFTNQVLECIVEQDANVEYYKIQNDGPVNSLVSTSHFRQTGKSNVHTVTITLNGGLVRNNLNLVMEADHCESHLYGLYYGKGNTHIDNHTIVDNVMPACFSNELYKGILDEKASAVFNGKIYVQRDAQKTNAYQSNKNVLLSNDATVNTKPQLEIFADDVKCSHGCTIGRLDDEGLFYLRSRGIPERIANALLLHGFIMDVLDTIKLEAIRNYVDDQISESLEYEIA
jgi:Fe-S cluster assembly protein SufD